jgi:hypothetical protein
MGLGKGKRKGPSTPFEQREEEARLDLAKARGSLIRSTVVMPCTCKRSHDGDRLFVFEVQLVFGGMLECSHHC